MINYVLNTGEVDAWTQSMASELSEEHGFLDVTGFDDVVHLPDGAFPVDLYWIELIVRVINEKGSGSLLLDDYFEEFRKIKALGVFHEKLTLWRMVNCLMLCRDEFRYSEYINCLIRVLREMGMLVGYPRHSVLFKLNWDNPRQKWGELISKIVSVMTTSQFIGKMARIDRRMQQTKASVESYVLKVLEKYKRALVLRVDFAYKAGHAASVTEGVARRDIGRLLANRRHNPGLIPDMVGYVCRIEWSLYTRYHFHVLFLLDGDLHRKDEHLAQQIGQYWVDVITKGRGRFHNCNRSRREFDRCGVGMVHLKKPDEVKDLLNGALGYLVKKDQHLIAKAIGHRKSIWTGQLSG